MLKIKADFDLKGLEKFGFRHQPEQQNQYEHYAYLVKDNYDVYPRLACCVWCNNRQIGVFNNNCGLCKVFDLISAGIVEKVEQ